MKDMDNNNIDESENLSSRRNSVGNERFGIDKFN